MKILGNEIKTGMIIEHKNDLWSVLKTQHVKPGKGGAFNQLELKSVKKGTKLNERFRSSDTVEKVILEDKKNEVYNIVGKYKKCLWELFEEVAKIENKKIIKINLNFVKKILPEIVKKQLRKRTGVLQQILSIDHSDFSERKIIL